MGVISFIVIAGGQAPAVGAIAFELLWIVDAVGVVDERMVLILFPVISVLIFQTSGVESEEGVVSKEEGTAIREAQRKGDAIVAAAVVKMIAFSPAMVIDLGIDG